jgi:mannose-6-phosphate isomerase-like protein (cupin superfamily)
MQDITFEQYEARSHARGFDEVTPRVWDAGIEVPTHTHPFSVEALVVAGEMWLTVDGDTRHLRPGDTFTLDREVPHAERYGAGGATYWAARRN